MKSHPYSWTRMYPDCWGARFVVVGCQKDPSLAVLFKWGEVRPEGPVPRCQAQTHCVKAHVPSSNLQGIWVTASQNPHGQFITTILEQRWRERDTSQYESLPGREDLDGFTHMCRPAVRQNFPVADKFQVNFQGGNQMRSGFENTENLVFKNLVARETLPSVLALPPSNKLNPN